MIRLKNVAEYVLTLKKTGAAAVANDVDETIVPAAGFLKAVVAGFSLIGTDGTGAPTQDVIVDIKKNGTSIFSGATKINFTHAKQVGGANTPVLADNYGALSTNPVPVAKGDRIQIDITQILNGTAPTQPQNLHVHLAFTKGYDRPPQGVLTGVLSELDN